MIPRLRQWLELPSALRFILSHPLNQGKKFRAFSRFLRWQIGSRLVPGPVVIDFIGDSRLLAAPGMEAATGNIYVGLHEFEDMSFLLHLLRKGDRFVDVGANIGSFTILATVAGADCMAFEPVPATFRQLCDNININGLHDCVRCLNLGISEQSGSLRFTTGLKTENRVITEEDNGLNSMVVPVEPLDVIAEEFHPTLIKIDVEGYETEVILGAKKILERETLLAVIMELNGAGERYGFNEEELKQRMIEGGFTPCRYDPFRRMLIEPDSSNPALSDNIIFVRKDESVIHRLLTAPGFLVNGKQI